MKEAERRKRLYKEISDRMGQEKLLLMIESTAREIAMGNNGIVTSVMVANKLGISCNYVGRALSRSCNFEKVPIGTATKGRNIGSPIYTRKRSDGSWTTVNFRYDPKPFRPRKVLRRRRRKKTEPFSTSTESPDCEDSSEDCTQSGRISENRGEPS